MRLKSFYRVSVVDFEQVFTQREGSNDNISLRMLCRYCFPGIALSINDQYCNHIQTSKLICKAYQLAGFYIMRVMIIKPFLAIAPILYHWKHQKAFVLFGVFRGYQIGKSARNWVHGLKSYCFLSSHFAHYFSSNSENAVIGKLK